MYLVEHPAGIQCVCVRLKTAILRIAKPKPRPTIERGAVTPLPIDSTPSKNRTFIGNVPERGVLAM